jgi:hypothetical protein
VSWPTVLPNDGGLRELRPGGCFYCDAPIGHAHALDCVTIVKRIAITVTATLPDGRTFRGTWELEAVHAWSTERIEAHHNEGTWCASNLCSAYEREHVTWREPGAWDALDAIHTSGRCLCGLLVFRFERVLDDTPRRGTS